MPTLSGSWLGRLRVPTEKIAVSTSGLSSVTTLCMLIIPACLSLVLDK